ncbi:MAG TPA: bifunctional helix-turn-helix transcriptional regulator/GNAT family N-acetyltransferase [Chitinophaga sp.]|uniref:bifunctional helix-turn-helix transcriptional regulator/GNAT family N-acetyltransferase n=1 Tax=Chitinophaga sp. TaxID=1869181 RepID=UPI002B66C9A9|nr:bifunctional helix-turn-helix transcriptional regulator/GNAT family N-acetyltransferase [Chitinophaga sp.]HVI44958.1 bifunctional helix-turn-helix transcriptional regulator/GNAT family N-acetyltransferase [Chitinophaga sp.]
MSSENNTVADIRHFNRFYTGVIGVLDNHILQSDYSLSEVRVLYEIGQQEKCTAGYLTSTLKVDGGYLSRMLRKFEKAALIARQQSSADGRTFFLHLSPKGRKLMTMLNERSSGEISQLLEPLATHQQEQVASAMKTIESILTSQPSPTTDIHYRYDLQPGDIGYLIHLHGVLYARETGYNLEFEAYVCKTFQDFLTTYNTSKDRVFLAVADGRIVGAVAILGASRYMAQLRWFLVHPDFRGRGLGRQLLNMAMAFCREKNYSKVYLLTTSMQTTAIEMYKKAGFHKTGEKFMQLWGQEMYEQRYEMEVVHA